MNSHPTTNKSKNSEELAEAIEELSIVVEDGDKGVKMTPDSFGDSISQQSSFMRPFGWVEWDYVGDLKESPYFRPYKSFEKLQPVVIPQIPREPPEQRLKKQLQQVSTATVVQQKAEKEPRKQIEEKQKDQTKEQPKGQAKEQAKEQPKYQSKEQPKDQAKEQSKEQAKEQPKEQTKDQAKEQPKEQAKEQSNDHAKDQPKYQVKEQPKDQAKEQPTKDTSPVVPPQQKVEAPEITEVKLVTSSWQQYASETLVLMQNSMSDFSLGEFSVDCPEEELVESEGDQLKYSDEDEGCAATSTMFSGGNRAHASYSNIDQTKIAFLSSKQATLPTAQQRASSAGDSPVDECVLYQAKDVMQLLLPDHAESVAVDAFLRMCKVNFIVDERINVEYMSPSGRGPLLRCGPVLVAEFESIVTFVESIGIQLTKQLTEKQLGEMQAYCSLLRTTLVPAELFVSWCHTATRLEVTELYYSQFHPYPLNIVVNRRKQQAAWELIKVLDRPLKSLADAYKSVDRCLRALNDRLGATNFFFGDSPTQLDALVYGHLLLLGSLPVPKGDSFLRSVLANYPSLVLLVERVDKLTERNTDLSFMKEGICEVRTKALIESYIEARQISSLAALGK